MNILAIETSGPAGGVAACRGEQPLAEESFEGAMAHGRMLVPLLDRVVRAAGWDRRRDIDLIAVSQGPGSFTGLRVGAAAAKALAMLLDRPLVGVCSFDAMAENAPAGQSAVLAALDARRGQVYAAAYQRQGGALQRVAGPALMPPDEARRLIDGPIFVLGDALRHHAAALGDAGVTAAPEDLWRIRAPVVARLALRAFQEGRRDDPVAFQPIYLRLAEAEEKRLAALASIKVER